MMRISPVMLGNSQPVRPMPARQVMRQASLDDVRLTGASDPLVLAPRFGGVIDGDYGVTLRSSAVLNRSLVAATTRSLLLRDLLKTRQQQAGTLKLFLDLNLAEGHTHTNRSALGDALRLIQRPVDVVVRGSVNLPGLVALLSATGRRFANPGARFQVGPLNNSAVRARNDDHNFRREWHNEYVRDLEYLIMDRSGQPDRRKVYDDLTGNTLLKSLEALHYGNKGLIDGVLVGFNRVVTREDLDAYIAAKGLSGKALAAFLKDYGSVAKLPSRPLAKAFPDSLPPAAGRSRAGLSPLGGWYPNLKAMAEKNQADKTKTDAQHPLTIYTQKPDGTVKIAKAAEIGRNDTIQSKDIKPGLQAIGHVPAGGGILSDDVIYFNAGFDDDSERQVSSALLALDEKRRPQANPSHIKILANSPGGNVVSGTAIRDTIHSLKTPVDVIVTGMGASCGAYLMASATGNRLMTPGARVMIHDASTEYANAPNDHYNQGVDRLNQVSRDFVGVIAKAARMPFQKVWEDMKADTWLNPLEAMFYGKNGLCDAIVVGADRVITKDDVRAYLLARFDGDEAEVRRYLAARNKSLQTPKIDWRPEDHDETDPFDNPLATIEAIARTSARSLESVPQLAGSVPREDAATGKPDVIDQYVVHETPAAK